MKTLNCIVVCLGLTSVVLGQLPSPSLTGVFPPGGSVGESVDVTLSGRDLDNTTQLVFSHAGIQGDAKYHAATEFEPRRLHANRFRIEIADNVSPGIYEVRAIGQFGVSTSYPFVVSENATVVESGNNHSPATAQKCTIDSIVFGRTDNNAVDHFRFSASKGQKILIRCLTKQIDSRLEPVIVIRSSAGKQLVRSPNIRVPEIFFVVPEDGNYTLCVNDHIFSGGADYPYAMTVSNAPILDLILPVAAQAGKTTEFTLLGRNIPGATDSEFSFGRTKLQQKTVRLYVPQSEALDGRKLPKSGRTFRYRMRTPQGDSNEVPIYLTSHPVVRESEKNDRKNPQRVSLPVELNGTFYPRRDEDWIRFSATKGQELFVDLIGNRLGTQTDPALFVWQVVVDGKGNESLKNINVTDDKKFDNGRFTRRIPRGYDSSSNDPTVRFKIPKDGDYCISVRDLFGNARADIRSTYRLVIKEVQPDFQLFAWSQRYRRDGNNLRVEKASPTLRPGETIVIPVDVNRQGGFQGDVIINVNGLPKGVHLAQAVVKGNQTEAILFLTADKDVSSFVGKLTITGTSQVGGQRTVRNANYGTLVTETGNIGAQKVVGRPTSEMWLAVLGSDPISASVDLASKESTFETSLGGKLEIPINYHRHDTLKGDLKLAAIGLPGQVKPGEVALKPDAKEGKLQIEVKDAKTPPGSYQVFLDGQVVATHQRNIQSIEAAESAKKKFETTLKAIVEDEKAAIATRDQIKQSDTKLHSDLEVAYQTLKTLALKTEIAKSAVTDKSNAATQTDSASPDSAKAARQVADAKRLYEEVAKQKADHELELSKIKEAIEASTVKLASAERQVKEASEKKKRAEAHKKSLEDRFNNIKKANGAKDTPFVLHTPPFTVNIVKSPLAISVEPVAVSVSASKTHDSEVQIKGGIERKFGFAEAIDAKVVPPKGIKAFKEVAFQLAKDKNEFSVKVPIGKGVKPGTHQFQITTKIKFNGIEISDSVPLVFTLTD